VDAYHGDVTLYIADERDPVIQTYARIFPEILRRSRKCPPVCASISGIPKTSSKSRPRSTPPITWTNPGLLQQEDQWTVASVTGSGDKSESQVMEPYYTIMKLPRKKPRSSFSCCRSPRSARIIWRLGW